MPPIVARAHALVAGCAAACISLSATADDLDVYRASIEARGTPNVLFVLDYSGSMGWDIEGNGPPRVGPARIDILKDAVERVLDAERGAINAGLSLYHHRPSGVRWPVADLDADANAIDPAIPKGSRTTRDVIKAQLERGRVGGGTATVNALADAALYFGGRRVTHNDADPDDTAHHRPDRWNPARLRYEGGNRDAALPASYLPRDAFELDAPWSGQYGECSDFSAAGGTNFCDRITKTKYACEDRRAGSWSHSVFSANVPAHRACRYREGDRWNGAVAGEEAYYRSPIEDSCAANAIVLISDGMPTVRYENATLAAVLGAPPSSCEDLSTSIFGNPRATQGNCGPELVRRLATDDQRANVDGSTVKTFAIGFAIDDAGKNYMQKLVGGDPSRFRFAEDPEGLSNALSGLINEIDADSESFAELAVDIDRASFSNDDRAYFNLFKPSRKRDWRGNLKGYYLGANGIVDTLGNGATVEDAQSGVTVFADAARSFWSDEADGADVTRGGASGELEGRANRRLLTWLGDEIPDGGTAPVPLDASNRAIDAALLGLPAGSPDRDAVLERLAGSPMGAPLHTRPVIVDYAGSIGRVVYTMTNQGFLHAIDATRPADATPGQHGGGEELFAFMPKRLLPNLAKLHDGSGPADFVYGLDGDITRWHDDTDGDGIVDRGERAMLVFGMRRGGDAYYALDVSSPASPKLLWRIDARTPGFERLGESWSRMSLIRAKRGTGSERFLVFGGGYDAAALDGATGPTASRGNAIYFVDRAGKLVEGIADRDMRYAIPSAVTPIDSDADGFADRLYVGDTGGQLWRVDFDDPRRDGVTTTRFADLAGGEHRPFFFAPSVALHRDGPEEFLSVAIGSGDRTDPNDRSSRDALFMVRDREGARRGAPARGYVTATSANLFDATPGTLDSSDADVARAARASLADKRGWRLELDAGEKSLSRVTSFDGRLLATTYAPDPSLVPIDCKVDPIARYYQLDLLTARATIARPAAAGKQASFVRAMPIDAFGIPPAPVVNFPEGGGTVQVIVGRELVNEETESLETVYWHAK